ncbi:MAG: phosphoglucosamine mutase [Hydrogenophilales bacterium]
MKLFGTDGIRGVVGGPAISALSVLKIGFAYGKFLKERFKSTSNPKIIIGKDTRISGYMLESALESGLLASGVDIILAGPLPTPAISHLVLSLRLQGGVVISASHNPYEDNGLKFFDEFGNKLNDISEDIIEKNYQNINYETPSNFLGKAQRIEDGVGRYIEFCKNSFSKSFNLKNFKLLIDCANGATYQIAPKIFFELGANVDLCNVSPDGKNINLNCGVLNPKLLIEKMKNSNYDYAIGFDGDGDRVIFVDKGGEVYNGDKLLYVLANFLNSSGKLKNAGVVGTHMTNMGIEKKFKQKNIQFTRTKVGDRYIIEELNNINWFLGGESSGHIVNLPFHVTGDGILSSLQILNIINLTGKGLSEHCGDLKIYPQKMRNVKCKNISNFKITKELEKLTEEIKQQNDGKIRILIRPSGTEPVIRILIEGEDDASFEDILDQIEKKIKEL